MKNNSRLQKGKEGHPRCLQRTGRAADWGPEAEPREVPKGSVTQEVRCGGTEPDP